MMQVDKALKAGYSIFCSTCSNFWEATDGKGPVGQVQCKAKDGCCSPLGGGSFHEYKGPISSTDTWCFVCGSPSTHLVAANNGKKFGMCVQHVELAHKLVPNGKLKPKLVIYSPRSVTSTEDQPTRKKPTLLEAISEVEKHYASKV